MLIKPLNRSHIKELIIRKRTILAGIVLSAFAIGVGALHYLPTYRCESEQTRINLEGYYRGLPNRAADAAMIQCLYNDNQAARADFGLPEERAARRSSSIVS